MPLAHCSALGLPTVLLLGGTDVYGAAFSGDDARAATMRSVASAAYVTSSFHISALVIETNANSRRTEPFVLCFFLSLLRCRCHPTVCPLTRVALFTRHAAFAFYLLGFLLADRTLWRSRTIWQLGPRQRSYPSCFYITLSCRLLWHRVNSASIISVSPASPLLHRTHGSSAGRRWPGLRPVQVVPQAVATMPDPQFDSEAYLATLTSSVVGRWHGTMPTAEQATNRVLFVLPAGLRSVKDVLYVARAVSQWHSDDPRVLLLIIGPTVDCDYAKAVASAVAQLPGTVLAPALMPSHFHALLGIATAVVNSSISEGMSGTVLEAMQLGVPVLVRGIAGNRAVVTHGKTGLIFDTPADFVSKAATLVSNAAMRDSLVANAKAYVLEKHSVNDEGRAYAALARVAVGVEDLVS